MCREPVLQPLLDLPHMVLQITVAALCHDKSCQLSRTCPGISASLGTCNQQQHVNAVAWALANVNANASM